MSKPKLRAPCDQGMEGTEGRGVQAHYQIDYTVKTQKLKEEKQTPLTFPGPIYPLDKSQLKFLL